MDINSIIHIVIYSNVVSFILGFILARNIKNSNSTGDNTTIFSKNYTMKQNNAEQAQKIKIEDTKFVVGVDTSNIEKKYESLGDVTTSQDNITNSIDKLKNLKK